MMSYLVIIIIVLVLVAIAIKVYLKATTGMCNSQVDLAGKTAIVTGANTGIGYYTALDFARRNGRVIIACRNLDKGREAQQRIVSQTDNDKVILKHLDLSSLKSVREFAHQIKEEEQYLHILVNSAGLAALPKLITEDGLERTYATNHFGPFLLTNLLLDLLKRSSPSRIVNVSSIVHRFGSIQLDNLCAERSFFQASTYCDTKLANILFTRELARQLDGTDVTCNCLHPGNVRTELLRSVNILAVLGSFTMKTPEEGAQTSIHCAVSEELDRVSGQYFMDCAIVTPATHALDDGMAKKLWEVSEKLNMLNTMICAGACRGGALIYVLIENEENNNAAKKIQGPASNLTSKIQAGLELYTFYDKVFYPTVYMHAIRYRAHSEKFVSLKLQW